jgi:hypothetical protein
MYSETGYSGQLADIQPSIIRTYANSQAIKAGNLVARKQQGSEVLKLATKIEDEILGISLRNVSEINDGIEYFKEKTPIAVLSFGSVYVQVESDVKSGQSVYVRVVADKEFKIGGFSGKEDTNKSNTLKLKNAKFVTSASSGKIAQIELLGRLELQSL